MIDVFDALNPKEVLVRPKQRPKFKQKHLISLDFMYFIPVLIILRLASKEN